MIAKAGRHCLTADKDMQVARSCLWHCGIKQPGLEGWKDVHLQAGIFQHAAQVFITALWPCQEHLMQMRCGHDWHQECLFVGEQTLKYGVGTLLQQIAGHGHAELFGIVGRPPPLRMQYAAAIRLGNKGPQEQSAIVKYGIGC